MATYRDLERRLLDVEALFETSEVRQGFDALRLERQDLERLSGQLLEALEQIAAGLAGEKLGAALDQPSQSLFSHLGRLSGITLNVGSVHLWEEVLRDAVSAASWMREERSERWGDTIFDISGLRREERTSSVWARRAKPPRYANAALVEVDGNRLLSPRHPLPTGAVFILRLDIGELSRESQVESPVRFPEHALPDADVWIDVMVSSTHFKVGTDRESLGRELAAHGRFFLPRDGSPAITSAGEQFLDFFLEAPGTPRGDARARVGYYFRDAVIQSQVLIADVGTGDGFRIATDFTVFESPDQLGAIPERPRISLFANHNGDSNQIAVRVRGDGARTSAGTSFEVRQQVIGDLVGKMRATLRDIAPVERRRSRAKLIADLRALALHGRALWTASAGQFLRVLNVANQDLEKSILHVTRSTNSDFTFPWTLLYHYHLDSDIPAERLTVCPLIERWDGKAPLFEGTPRKCPESDHVRHENILCPFGFWGFRYSLEQITATDQPVPVIEVPDAPRVVVAETQFDVDPRQLADHVAQLRAVLTAAFPNVDLREGKDKESIHQLLGTDLPLVYFFCHGQKINIADPNTFLGVGKHEKITASDLIGWVQTWLEEEKLNIWDRVRPLVFINACHSVEINPDTLVSYLAAFVGTARAAGVIGTEVKVHQGLAMEFAQAFFEHFVRDNWSVDRALHQVRLDFLRDGNLIGLLYTPYCWADLHLQRAR